MNRNLIPAQTITLETIKEILTSAYYSTQPYESEDVSETNIIIVEMSHVNIFISLNSNLNMITFSTFFFPEEQSLEKLLWHVNYLNSTYKITKFYLEELNDGVYVINADFMMNIKAGLDAFTFIDNLRLFHDLVGLAMQEELNTLITTPEEDTDCRCYDLLSENTTQQSENSVLSNKKFTPRVAQLAMLIKSELLPDVEDHIDELSEEIASDKDATQEECVALEEMQALRDEYKELLRELENGDIDEEEAEQLYTELTAMRESSDENDEDNESALFIKYDDEDDYQEFKRGDSNDYETIQKKWNS